MSMVYAVYTIEKFDKQFEKLSDEYQRRIQNLFLQLKENPYVGDQLQIRILREKRLEEKRIYYLVYNDLQAVLVVAISNKKTQQETINRILRYLNEYRYLLEKLLNKD